MMYIKKKIGLLLFLLMHLLSLGSGIHIKNPERTLSCVSIPESLFITLQFIADTTLHRQEKNKLHHVCQELEEQAYIINTENLSKVIDTCLVLLDNGQVSIKSVEDLELCYAQLKEAKQQLETGRYQSAHIPVYKKLMVDEEYIPENMITKNGMTGGNTAIINGPLQVNYLSTTQSLNVGEDVFIQGTGNINGSLNVTGAAAFSDDLSIANNISVGGTGTIAGNALINGNTNIAGNLNITGAASLANDLSVGGSGSIVNNLFVGGNEFVTGDLNVIGTTFLSDSFTVGATGTINGNVIINGTTDIAGNLQVTGPTVLNNDLTLIGNAFINDRCTIAGNLNVSGNETINGTLNVTGPTSLANNLSIGGTGTISGNALINGTADIAGNLNATGPASFANNLSIGGTGTIAGNLNVSGNETINGTLNVTGATSLANNLSVGGTGTISGNALINGTADIAGNLNATGPASFANNLSIGGTGTIAGNLNVSGNETINGMLNVTGPTSLANNLSVAGTGTISGNLKTVGTSLFNSDVTLQPSSGNTINMIFKQANSFEKARLSTSTGSSTASLALSLDGGVSQPVLAQVGPINAPLVAPTVAATVGGSIAAGTYNYVVTFVTAGGETTVSPTSASVTLVVLVSTAASLTAIPLGPSNIVTARKIYRSTAGPASPYGLVGTINDNTTTTFTDTSASIGTAPPSSNTTSAFSLALNGTNGTFNSNILQVNGGISALIGTISVPSDERLKEDIESIDDYESLKKVCALQPRTFRYNEQYQKEVPVSHDVQKGFIAQEVEQVFPEYVFRQPMVQLGDATLYDVRNITTGGGLVVDLVGALRACFKEIQDLQNRVYDLENR